MEEEKPGKTLDTCKASFSEYLTDNHRGRIQHLALGA